jgi:hypothetical protein
MLDHARAFARDHAQPPPKTEKDRVVQLFLWQSFCTSRRFKVEKLTF